MPSSQMTPVIHVKPFRQPYLLTSAFTMLFINATRWNGSRAVKRVKRGSQLGIGGKRSLTFSLAEISTNLYSSRDFDASRRYQYLMQCLRWNNRKTRVVLSGNTLPRNLRQDQNRPDLSITCLTVIREAFFRTSCSARGPITIS